MPHRLTPVAKRLRRNLTDVERLLWRQFRAHRFAGYKFKRQQPLGHFVVDFVCFEQKLVIELDGGQHAEQTRQDRDRDAWLISEGYRVLRFWNNDVTRNLEGVMQRIADDLSPSPQPSPARGEGVEPLRREK